MKVLVQGVLEAYAREQKGVVEGSDPSQIVEGSDPSQIVDLKERHNCATCKKELKMSFCLNEEVFQPLETVRGNKSQEDLIAYLYLVHIALMIKFLSPLLDACTVKLQNLIVSEPREKFAQSVLNRKLSWEEDFTPECIKQVSELFESLSSNEAARLNLLCVLGHIMHLSDFIKSLRVKLEAQLPKVINRIGLDTDLKSKFESFRFN